MAFSTHCNNKGCGKIQEPYIDPQNDKVYCSLCHGEISNLTHFAKMQMKSSKQFKQKSNTSFAVKCNVCGREERPKIVNGEVVCGHCSGPLNNLSPIFKNMLKEKLKLANKDI